VATFLVVLVGCSNSSDEVAELQSLVAELQEQVSLTTTQAPATTRATTTTRPQATTRATTTTRPKAENQEQAGKDTGGYATYIFQPGDTLWDVAKNLLGDGSRWREIEALNEIEDHTAIPDGIRLKIPSEQPVSTSTTTGAPTGSAPAATTSTSTTTTVVPTTTSAPATTTTTSPPTTTVASYSYTEAERGDLIGYCSSQLTACTDMVNDATRVGTPRTCSPVQIRNWMSEVSMFGYPANVGVSLTTVETECGPIY